MDQRSSDSAVSSSEGSPAKELHRGGAEEKVKGSGGSYVISQNTILTQPITDNKVPPASSPYVPCAVHRILDPELTGGRLRCRNWAFLIGAELSSGTPPVACCERMPL